MVCVEFYTDKARSIILGAIYKPPSMNPDNFLENLHQNLLLNLRDEVSKDIMTMGDINANVTASKRCKYAKVNLSNQTW